MRTKDIASISTENIFENDKFITIMDKFRKADAAVLPVVDSHGVCLGCVQRHHLYEADVNKFSLARYTRPLFVKDYDHIIEAMRFALANEAECVAVIDDDGYLLGMLKTKDLFRHFCMTSGLVEKGSMLVIDLQRVNYSLTEIAKIVESNNATILHHYISSHPDSQRIEVTLLINVNDISDIIATFERFKYSVTYSSVSSDIEELMQERYDSLMHFLEI